MRGWVILLAAAAMASSARGADAGIPQRTLPGLQPDGDTLLHNQWPIHPVGDQVGLGDFPVGMAVHPGGRLAAVLHAGQGRHEVRIVDLASGRALGAAPLNEAFFGIAYSADGRSLVCSGGSDGVLRVFSAEGDRLVARGDVVVDRGRRSVVAFRPVQGGPGRRADVQPRDLGRGPWRGRADAGPRPRSFCAAAAGARRRVRQVNRRRVPRKRLG